MQTLARALPRWLVLLSVDGGVRPRGGKATGASRTPHAFDGHEEDPQSGSAAGPPEAWLALARQFAPQLLEPRDQTSAEVVHFAYQSADDGEDPHSGSAETAQPMASRQGDAERMGADVSPEPSQVRTGRRDTRQGTRRVVNPTAPSRLSHSTSDQAPQRSARSPRVDIGIEESTGHCRPSPSELAAPAANASAPSHRGIRPLAALRAREEPQPDVRTPRSQGAVPAASTAAGGADTADVKNSASADAHRRSRLDGDLHDSGEAAAATVRQRTVHEGDDRPLWRRRSVLHGSEATAAGATEGDLASPSTGVVGLKPASAPEPVAWYAFAPDRLQRAAVPPSAREFSSPHATATANAAAETTGAWPSLHDEQPPSPSAAEAKWPELLPDAWDAGARHWMAAPARRNDVDGRWREHLAREHEGIRWNA
ncbi:MAG: hypothetical protein IPM60_03430 [Rhodospirillales bacterium]|nr:hypothetical protein [Rhodospirillales bacterium]